MTLCTHPDGFADYQVPRTAVLDQLNSRVTLAEHLSETLGENEREGLLRQVRQEITDTGRQQLPETMSASSERDIQASLPTIVLNYDNIEFNRLLARKSLTDVKLNIAFQRYVPDLSDTQTKALENDIRKVVDRMRESMVKHIGQYFVEEEINDHLEQVQADLLAKIPSKNTYAFKRRPQPEILADFLAEFDRRLELTASRVPERLAAGDDIDDQIQRDNFVKALRHGILMEITVRTITILAEKTIEPELAGLELNPDDFAPGYLALVHTIGRMERKLRDEQRKKRTLERMIKRAKAEADFLVQESPAMLMSPSPAATSTLEVSESRTVQDSPVPSETQLAQPAQSQPQGAQDTKPSRNKSITLWLVLLLSFCSVGVVFLVKTLK
ncbi:MAG: hypothetical protein ACYTBJ_10905 [Planctomycetota bacterium]|jgi:hypothetical protein